MKYRISINNKNFDVEIKEKEKNPVILINDRVIEYKITNLGDGEFFVSLGNYAKKINVVEKGKEILVYFDGNYFPLQIQTPQDILTEALKKKSESGERKISVSMPGKVVKILVKKGNDVQENQGLIIIEAMKMENEIRSPKKGIVKEVNVHEGDTIEAYQTLMIIG